jgi:hypothetical protein
MRKLIVPAVAAGLLMLFGCGQQTTADSDTTTEERAEQAGDDVEEAANDAGEAVEDAGENAADAVDDATDGNPNTNP